MHFRSCRKTGNVHSLFYFSLYIFLFFSFFGNTWLRLMGLSSLQPLFPGESGVDQLVEIIKVWHVVILFLVIVIALLFSILSLFFWNDTRFLEHQPEKK